MVYSSTESDPDVWIKRRTTDNNNAYYKYLLVYVDVIHLTKDSHGDMLELNQVYLLKEGFGSPDI